jgi:hypothetical protein
MVLKINFPSGKTLTLTRFNDSIINALKQVGIPYSLENEIKPAKNSNK